MPTKFLCWMPHYEYKENAIQIEAASAICAAEYFVNRRLIGYGTAEEHAGVTIFVCDSLGNTEQFLVVVENKPVYRVERA